MLARLSGTEPGAAHYLMDPFLNAQARKDYKRALLSILDDIPKLAGRCDDGGRLERLQRAAIITINLINTIAICKAES
jgi:hypothetical protein